MSVVVAILVFCLIVMVHETGHFIAAKLAGIAVYRFSIGFGPAIFKKKIGGTVYALRLLPLGGAVEMRGEEGEDSDEMAAQFADVPGKSFREAGVFERFWVCIAGSVMNFVTGLLILLILMAPISAIYEAKLSGFMEGFAHEGAGGFEVGDQIVNVNGFHVFIYSDFLMALELGAGNPYDFTVIRDGKKIKLEGLDVKKELVDPQNPGTPKYGFIVTRTNIGFFGRLRLGVDNALSFLQSAVKSIGMLIGGKVSGDQMMGTVGIAGEISERAKQSAEELWYFVAFLSVNLAFVNMLPFPALDGGKVVFLIIELLRGKPASAKVEGYLTAAGLVMIFALFIFVTYHDIARLIAG